MVDREEGEDGEDGEDGEEEDGEVEGVGEREGRGRGGRGRGTRDAGQRGGPGLCCPTPFGAFSGVTCLLCSSGEQQQNGIAPATSIWRPTRPPGPCGVRGSTRRLATRSVPRCAWRPVLHDASAGDEVAMPSPAVRDGDACHASSKRLYGFLICSRQTDRDQLLPAFAKCQPYD